MLGIVEHEQQRARREVFRERIEQRCACPFLDAQDGGDRLRKQPCVRQCGKLHEPRAVGIGMDLLLREHDRQAGLAAPTGAGQREQSRVTE